MHIRHTNTSFPNSDNSVSAHCSSSVYTKAVKEQQNIAPSYQFYYMVMMLEKKWFRAIFLLKMSKGILVFV